MIRLAGGAVIRDVPKINQFSEPFVDELKMVIFFFYAKCDKFKITLNILKRFIYKLISLIRFIIK